MKKILYTILCLVSMMTFSSCSEADDSTYEFDNWQQRNDTYFNSIYSQAEASIGQEKDEWRIYNKWSKVEDAIGTDKTNKIVVKVIQKGTGKESPLYSDSVRVHYEGRLMETPEHPEGTVFDCSWTGDYNPNTMVPTKFLAGGLVDGFTTALLHMHVGDRWKVYIPYNLAYGASKQSSIPAYSTLVFDITLHSFSRPGYTMPKFQ